MKKLAKLIISKPILGLVLIVLIFFAAVLLIQNFITPARVMAATRPNFQDSVVFSGLTNPTTVRFSPDGRIFVAEKSGLIKVFDNLIDTTPLIFADLRTNVHNFWDRGLLSIALDPSFPTKPYVYVLYTYDAAIGESAPRWGIPNTTSDGCPTPPGPTTDGCVVSGRLSRLQISGNTMAGSEQVLIEGWCQQYPSHTTGSLAFGADGALYVTGGDGASFTFADFGQAGNPANPCNDPNREGGALRSQDLQTTSDPVGLNGAVLRLNPDTGEALPDNPLFANSDPNARRIIGYGLRNPFRMAIKPGTNEVWLGDVGWIDWEEINTIPNPTSPAVANFGWPCYEGPGQQPSYAGLNLSLCQNLYNQNGSVTGPVFTYRHSAQVTPSDNCPVGSSSVSGVAFQFYSGSLYPSEYNGALFFADYSRDCIWVMFKDANNKPDPLNIQPFVTGAASPVDLQISPEGELFYADFDGGTIRRVQYGITAPNPLPSPWQDQDIGNTGVPGNASFSANQFFVGGSGADIWGSNDAFHFAYQPLSGDGTITARVTSVQNTNVWAKAGVMIRESLAADAKNTFIAVTSQKGITYQKRTSTSGFTAYTLGASVQAPYWVKLTRLGNTFSAYQSSNGINWNLIRSDTISMAPGVFVGLALTGHDNTVLNNSVFDSVNVTKPSGNNPPAVTISTPSSNFTWKVGDSINFSGSATDPENGLLPSSALTWTVILHHCPSNCHSHALQTFSGVSSGSFNTPDHEYPSYLELKLTAKDTSGAESVTSINLNPQTSVLSLNSNPAGLQLGAGTNTAATPFTGTFIVNSSVSLNAPSPQLLGGINYNFTSWSDGGAANHTFTAPANNTSVTANFTQSQAAANGLNATYFDNPDFTGTSFSRIDPKIDFIWGTASPLSGIGADTFSVRWTGFIVPAFNQAYTFYANTDDGVRVWVNNQLIIDKWVNKSAYEVKSSPINLVAGQKYSLKVEYFDNTNSAQAQLLWSSPSQAKSIIPQSSLFTN